MDSSEIGSPSTMELMGKLRLRPGISVKSQVANFLRDLIVRGELVPETRIPPIRTLATLWDTYYAQVQGGMHLLLREGLLVQRPKIGTYVGAARKSISRICLYHAIDMEIENNNTFLSHLHFQLCHLLSEKGIAAISLLDRRSKTQKRTIHPELRRLINERLVDGVIISEYNAISVPWIRQLTLPTSVIYFPGQGHALGGVSMDLDAFSRLATEAVVRSGKRRLGIICADPVCRSKLEGWARKKNLSVVIYEEPPLRAIDLLGAYGFEACGNLLKADLSTDAIISHPDTATQGVINALMREGIHVPKGLVLISHRNKEMPIFEPFPVQWLTVSIKDFALALLEQLQRRLRGEVLATEVITPTFE